MAKENKKHINNIRKPVLGFLSIAAIGLAIFGQSFIKEVAIVSWGFMSAQVISIFKEKPGLNPIIPEITNPLDDETLPENCWYTNFSNKDINGWDFSPYKLGSDGFYTTDPKIYTSYWAPEIWLKRQIVTAFSELEFRAEIRNDINSPTLIVAFGKEPKKLIRFRVGDGNPQVVTFGRIVPIPGSSNYGFEPLGPAKILTDPMRKGVSSVVTIKTKYSGGDKLNYHFVVSYLSDKTNKGQVDNLFDYSVELPDTKPISQGGVFQKTDFGFAVYKGSGIKPINFKICPFNPD